jgi:hypothetical protein
MAGGTRLLELKLAVMLLLLVKFRDYLIQIDGFIFICIVQKSKEKLSPKSIKKKKKTERTIYLLFLDKTSISSILLEAHIVT